MNNISKQKPSKPARQRPNTQVRAKKQKKSSIDPKLLVVRAEPTNYEPYVSKRSIEDLPINQALKNCLLHKGFTKPTEIQDRTLEPLLSKRDLLGIAQTGTGKTAAFLVPIINEIMVTKPKNFALVVVPTRELALQVEEEFKTMSKGLGLFSASFIGGTNINKDMQNLRRQSHIVIGTPGRILDLVNRRALDLGAFNTLVLDEFDRMLDMGFVRDVKRILSGMHHRKHTLLFSATLDKNQEQLISTILNNPITVKVTSGDSAATHIDQDIVRITAGEDKFAILKDMLVQSEYEKVLLFEETKFRVKRLCQRLNQAGIRANDIHGNKSQSARQSALTDFKQGRIKVLVATDVAARGIDVSDVTHVINYQVPQTFDSYIHRIGRTGRAGKTGKAFTFID
jgi:ATP-dependent RNA helicase RhlE